MKQVSILCLITMLSLTRLSAQQPYEVISDPSGEKILKGLITRDLLQKDSGYKWYADGLKGYTPNKAALEALTKNKDSINLVVFMGTWCGDSHFVIPKFFSLLDAAGFPMNRVTLIGVDRNKKTLAYLAEAFHLINVPTIIVMKKGLEKGRVVEYGKSGSFDKDLGEIINAAL